MLLGDNSSSYHYWGSKCWSDYPWLDAHEQLKTHLSFLLIFVQTCTSQLQNLWFFVAFYNFYMASSLQGITDCLTMLLRYRLNHITNGLLMVPNQFVWQGKILWLKGFYQSVQNKYLLSRIHTSAYIFMCLLPIQTSPDCSGWVSLLDKSLSSSGMEEFLYLSQKQVTNYTTNNTLSK